MALSIEEWIKNPATLAVGITTLLGGVLHIPILVAAWSALWATAGQLFGGISIFAFVIAPEVDFLPEGPLIAAALTIGLLAGVKQLWNWSKTYRDKL